MTSVWTQAIARAEAHAPFLAGAMGRWPALVDLAARGEGEAALAMARGVGAELPVGAMLRQRRDALAMVLALGDLAGAFPLERVTGELSALADFALDSAIRAGIEERAPGGGVRGFTALGLGKHGAGELNYSSDIDPILLYDPETLPRRAGDDPGEAAQRVARRVVELLSRRDEYGYVFRVDLRLRPASEVSPLAIPIEGAISHYESAALAWERAAFIRARAAAGDVAMGEGFLKAIRPFVWRKSLDFGAIAEIGRLTQRIRAHHGKVAVPGPGFDVKRGRGGIREVEFFAQTHQLIHGGRLPALRLRDTRATLAALAEAGLVDPADAALLAAAYTRLRTIEHRLQMVGDQQTHSLPASAEALDQVARLDGLADGAALVAELAGLTEQVATRYDRLIDSSSGVGGASVAVPDQASLEDQLGALGFADPARLAQRIEGWRSGTIRALRSDAALAALDAVQPALLRALAEAPDPDRALTRWEQMIQHLPSAVNLFRLLEARPGLLALLARVLGLAPPLADALARRGDLLDALIDASAFDLPGDVASLVADFTAGEGAEDYERLLDRVRRRVGELRFALGVQLVEGAQDPLEVAAALARVAEAAIATLVPAAEAEFARVHGGVPGGELVLLGLGRLGGAALTPASDLDLVYLFTGDFAAESDGGRPLGATLYFNRLAQRITAALSVPTAEGALYEVDTRLRPQGAKGPLAVSIEGFASYQAGEAWTWEHMALCRARVVHGSAGARAALEAIIADTLRSPRDPAALQAEVLEMRGRMAQHKPARGPLDVKLARGGLVDLEFMIHFCQLRDGVALRPELTPALGELIAGGLLPADLAVAHGLLARLLVVARLIAPDGAEPPEAARATLAKACQCGDWAELTARLLAARQTVGAAWATLFGEQLEIV
ncbi:MAG: bifunctional [glutamine synthetase] adenylyltransferase/[glutamine synthetase]-adenylyl-L-tyrosine phosphorylase [Proteobacteria bacterium]|nr:bifunctional [glutamine synthetase] adenylyltransferase/[glutamine synthetase]-adenylyl-L-tyrosine phosphorylase [Pseudomonadota bacterium]